MKEYLIAYYAPNDTIQTCVCCGKDMCDAISQFRKFESGRIVAITELDESINSNCL